MHAKKIFSFLLITILFILSFGFSYKNLSIFTCMPSFIPGIKNVYIEKIINYGIKHGQSAFCFFVDTLYFPCAVSANFILPKDLEPVSITPVEELAAEPLISDNSETYFEQTISHTAGNVKINDISIINQTSYAVDNSSLLNGEIPFAFPSSQASPTVLIIHTHATESFAQSQLYNFNYTSNSRTTDNNYNVVRIGSELEKELKGYGINVIHDITQYDYPNYNNSYDNAFAGIKSLIKKYPSISVVLDLHRDAVNDKNGNKVKLTGEVDGKKAAQIMFVVGTDECGFSHPNWLKNLKFASMLQNQLINISPSLVRPINLRTSRFNQHFTNGSLIVEIGTNGNTLDEAIVSAGYLAKAISDTVKMLS